MGDKFKAGAAIGGAAGWFANDLIDFGFIDLGVIGIAACGVAWLVGKVAKRDDDRPAYRG